MRSYMWSNWLLAFEYPEVLARADPDNIWAKMRVMAKIAERDAAERELFGDTMDQFTRPKTDYMPTITLEGQRKT